MAKIFNTTAACIPEEHYMVNIDRRLEDIKALVDQNKYFTINRARQYGKTTTLKALAKYLREEYYVVSMDFQKFDALKFENGNIFSVSFLTTFLRLFQTNRSALTDGVRKAINDLKECMILQGSYFGMKELFEGLSDICSESEKPVVLIIDEVDSAANNQVFLDFLAQLRAYYIDRRERAAFWSVILAGVYDIKNLRYKIRPEDEHKVNSSWNTHAGNEENERWRSFDECPWYQRAHTPFDIAADFEIDMSLSEEGVAGMLLEYETDYHTGMDVEKMAGEIYQYTSGYPFLVSRLCQLMDEKVSRQEEAGSKAAAWTKKGFLMAVNMLLAEKNTLFESLIGKLDIYPSLNVIIKDILFAGRPVACNPDLAELDLAAMFGFIKNQNGQVEVANRIFETRLYNLYLSEEEFRRQDICRKSMTDKSQFITDGRLNMRRILEKFAEHFHELYGNRDDTFKEEEDMNQKERMLNGLPYKAWLDHLGEERDACKAAIYEFNLLKPDERARIPELLKKLFGKTGKNIWIEPPFHCDYGWNIEAGENFFANYGLTVLDVGKVTFGDNVQIAPNVSIYTAGHPIHPVSRNSGYEYGIPITIGNNVWIGGSVVILPGVTIGDNVVIGAGSVVTKDIPANMVAVGNPCRIIREITEEDRKFYYKDREFDVTDY